MKIRNKQMWMHSLFESKNIWAGAIKDFIQHIIYLGNWKWSYCLLCTKSVIKMFRYDVFHMLKCLQDMKWTTSPEKGLYSHHIKIFSSLLSCYCKQKLNILHNYCIYRTLFACVVLILRLSYFKNTIVKLLNKK